MQLQTQIPFEASKAPINYESRLVLLGSCFSEHMGAKLAYYHFRSLQNPLGILFHPMAIENLIDRAVHEKSYTAEEVFFANERWHCWDAHSNLSSETEVKLLEKLNAALAATFQQVRQATHILITLGTAFAYRHMERDETVANCHKIPQTAFSKQLLSVASISKSLENIVEIVQSINEKVQFVFTVSPVRHLKDGFVANQRSKAHLISAIHDVLENDGIAPDASYFPSYELQMDELRDYRFYASDMVHPNQVAVEYIWEKFKQVYITEEAQTTMEKVETIQKGLAHRAFNPDSVQHQQFLKSLEAKIAYLQKRHAWMQFSGATK